MYGIVKACERAMLVVLTMWRIVKKREMVKQAQKGQQAGA
ncbi:hypothetical protein EV294_101823 [Paenibacillus sp. BK033]|nr:hypothetical protein EV294_101823 [Paenibacillus sp. BK033]